MQSHLLKQQQTASTLLIPFLYRVWQPGAFATAVGSPTNFKKPANYIDGYDSAHGWMNMLSDFAGREPGDTRKGVQRIIQLVQQEELPMRFALGVSQV